MGDPCPEFRPAEKTGLSITGINFDNAAIPIVPRTEEMRRDESFSAFLKC